VHVLAPLPLRAALALDAMAKGLPTFIETPIAADFDAAEKLLRSAQMPGAPQLFVSARATSANTFNRLGEILRQGSLGRLRTLTCLYATQQRHSEDDGEEWQSELPITMLLEQAGDFLGQLLLLTGPMVDSQGLSASMATCGGVKKPQRLQIKVAGEKCDAVADLHFDASYPASQITAYCSDGMVSADLLCGYLRVQRATSTHQTLDDLTPPQQAQSRLGGNARVQAEQDIRSFLSGEAFSLEALARAAEVNALCEKLAKERYRPADAPAIIRSLAERPPVLLMGDRRFLTHHILEAFKKQGVAAALALRDGGEERGAEYTDGVPVHRIDPEDAKGLAELLRGRKFVINTVPAPQSEVLRNRCLGAFIEACLSAGIRRVVHISSIHALNMGARTALDSRAPVNTRSGDTDPANLAMAFSEIRLLAAYEEDRLPVCILRPGLVVGEGSPLFPAPIGELVNGRHCLGWNRGAKPLPFVLAEDIASACVSAALAPDVNGRCFNLVGDVRLSAREYVEELAKALGRPLVFHPRSTKRIYAEQLRNWLLDRGDETARPSLAILRSRAMRATLECGDAKRLLGWSPVGDRQTFITKAIHVHRQDGTAT
jgi:nucleoside-diphosphate-sugar epimerase/predicted dehydrogenase